MAQKHDKKEKRNPSKHKLLRKDIIGNFFGGFILYLFFIFLTIGDTVRVTSFLIGELLSVLGSKSGFNGFIIAIVSLIPLVVPAILALFGLELLEMYGWKKRNRELVTSISERYFIIGMAAAFAILLVYSLGAYYRLF